MTCSLGKEFPTSIARMHKFLDQLGLKQRTVTRAVQPSPFLTNFARYSTCPHTPQKFLKFCNTWRAADCKLDYIHYKFQKLGGLHHAASESLSERVYQNKYPTNCQF